MRKILGEFLYEKAKTDDKIIILIGDTGYGIFDKFREEFPNRFYNLGLAEQSMISIAGGLALQGMKPWVYAITPFLIERPYEQIKIDIMMNNANVKLVGYDDYPTQGLTHQCDYGDYILKPLGIKSYLPKSKDDMIKYINEMYESNKPAFMRMRKLR